MSNFLTNASSEFHAIASANALAANWGWSEYGKTLWQERLVNRDWKVFADKWSNVEDVFDPVSKRLDFNSPELPAVPQSLFVRDIYLKTEEKIWNRAKGEELQMSGCIVTGQPGIGKTFFIWYLLVRLLQMKQVVLFNLPTDSLLFYQGEVYKSSDTSDFSSLPRPLNSNFIWSLFDLDQTTRPFVIAPTCFPVQTTSPNPHRYREWQNQRGPLFTGLPLWTHEELASTAQLDPRFGRFSQEVLTKKWKDITHRNSGIIEFLMEVYPQDAPMPPDAPIPPDTPDGEKEEGKVFDILLNSLVSRFGPIPRDVFYAMFGDFNEVVRRHQSALAVGFEELRKIMDALKDDLRFPDATSPSHCLISIDVIEGTWKVYFKSLYIGHQVSQRLAKERRKEAHNLVEYFLKVHTTRSFAGTLFEPHAHEFIQAGAPGIGDEQWHARKLDSNMDDNAPIFWLNQAITKTIPCFQRIPRRLVSFDNARLPEVLKHDEYYIPCTPNFPLFDSFVVSFNFPTRSARLWILQMSTVALHRGSENGYLEIRNIVKKVKEQLKSGRSDEPAPTKKQKLSVEPSVQVIYLFVRCAEDEEQSPRWLLPKGWSKYITQTDHQGPGYLLDISIRSRYFTM